MTADRRTARTKTAKNGRTGGGSGIERERERERIKDQPLLVRGETRRDVTGRDKVKVEKEKGRGYDQQHRNRSWVRKGLEDGEDEG